MSDTLPFGVSHARSEDPATSKAAAASALDMAEGHCAAIHMMLTRYSSGQSASQLADRIPHLSRHQILKRLPDLEMQGLAHPTGVTRTGHTGRQERVWAPGPDPDPKPKPPTLTARVAELERRLTELENRHA